jgi:Gram-negative bacterial TonB protein C-terminal
VKQSPAFIGCVLLSFIFSVSAATTSIVNGHSSQETAGKKQEAQPKAVVRYKPEPPCPMKATEQGIEATISLRAIFRESGKVTDIRFDRASPVNLPADILEALTEESIKAAEKIRFEPATKDGHPVSMYMLLQYNFDCR